jgi:sterol desaturase/sphingolipid hydroxylase (fatty acid hydroxylase superfamily)
MLGFPIGLLYANAGEWLFHKHVLHGLGKRRESFWSFHFHEHHQESRRHGMLDEDYHRPLRGWHGQSKEALALALAALAHAPLLPVAPGFTLGVWTSMGLYYARHKRAHLDPQWARDHLPWHLDHHLGPDQDQNWCVTFPWFDWVMGTRVPYAGTEREAADVAKREARAKTRTAPSVAASKRPAMAQHLEASAPSAP